MSKTEPTIISQDDVVDFLSLQRWVGVLQSQFSTSMYQLRTVLGVEGATAADVIRVTSQVVDRIGRVVKARFTAQFAVLDTAYDFAGGATGVTITYPVAASQKTTASTSQAAHWWQYSDASGLFTVDLKITGAGTRHFHAWDVEPFESVKSVTWS